MNWNGVSTAGGWCTQGGEQGYGSYPGGLEQSARTSHASRVAAADTFPSPLLSPLPYNPRRNDARDYAIIRESTLTATTSRRETVRLPARRTRTFSSLSRFVPFTLPPPLPRLCYLGGVR